VGDGRSENALPCVVVNPDSKNPQRDTVKVPPDSADFIFLMNQVKLTRGNLSSHLNPLEEAGYVDIQKEFVDKVPRTLIRLTETGRNAIQAYREQMRTVIDELLG